MNETPIKEYSLDDLSRESDTKRILDAFDSGRLVQARQLAETKNQLNRQRNAPVLFGVHGSERQDNEKL